MKTLHSYLLRQILASLLLTVAVFTFVLLLANVLKDLLKLVNAQVGFGLVAEAVGLLIPFVWVFALPMGMLTATLLIFGRFSADQELTAVRSSGVSLLSLISPILLLSLVLCAVSAMVNMEIGPRCRAEYTNLRARLMAEFSKVQLPEGRFIKDFPGYIISVGKNRKGTLQDVMIYQFERETNWLRTVHAPRGQVDVDTTNKLIVLHLYDFKSVIGSEGKTKPGPSGECTLQFDWASPQKASRQPSISDMSFTELWDELGGLEQGLVLPMSLRNLSREQLQVQKGQLEKQRADAATQIRVQMHRQVAFSFACFGFTLIGIPLGVRVHRRETNVGVAIALLLVAVYYSFILLGQALDTRPEWSPHLIVWAPNFLFEAVGAVLLWRANRGV